jgi:LPXTG-motif cell wall-anchored protein
MKHDSTRRRRAAAGLACITIGSVAVVAGLAAPAAAHDGEREPTPVGGDLSCAEIADQLGITADWTEFSIAADDLPAEGESADYDLTPEDTNDDATVTIEMVMALKNFNWSSSIGIDGVYVDGGDNGSTFYGYQPELAGYQDDNPGEIVGDGEERTQDIDLGTLPWHEGPEIKQITFCYDGEQTTPPSSTPPSSTPPSTECPEAVVDTQTGMDTPPSSTPPSSTPPTSEPECETPTTAPPTTAPPTTAPSTTVSIEPDVSTTVLDSGPTTTLPITPQSNSLPDTGSNTTPLILGGLVLLAIGGGLVAGNKWLRKT